MKRRSFLRSALGSSITTTTALVASLPWLPGCGGGGGSASPTEPAPHAVTINVDAAATGIAVNRRVLGSNVEWVDRGDNLLDSSGHFDPTMLGLVQAMSPAVLRYPGGLQSDTFHWEQADNEHAFTRAMQPTLMTPQRLLELCEATGAEPLFTVNVVTGSADEAARWVHAANIDRAVSSITGRPLPRVDFWEIGNEPYLKVDSRPDLDIAPAEFARRANLFIRAMRAVDPTIRIGLPLTQDTRNDLPVTPYPGFARTVLDGLTEPFDFVAVHNAYLPFAYTAGASTNDLYAGAIAAAESVRDDFVRMRALLAELRPGATIPLAVTEHAPLFSLGLGATDDWSTTPLGALYLADLLRVFADTPDLLLANHWSLSGNGRFGALGGNDGSGTGGFNRASADVLTLASQVLHGNRLDVAITCESVATPAIGLVPARSALPLMSALITREGNTLRALLIHKDSTRDAQVRFDLAGASAGRASLTTLTAPDVTRTDNAPGLWQRSVTAPAGGTSVALNLPPHSVVLLELTM
ncbi:MAG: hypothetical protein Q7T97_09245 [Burkholderiaceae bacterium]|nr:hypothetical protein [Burkholderiaceae bacterium]